MKSIRVFDLYQYRDACEQAESMRGSDQPLNECIEFGRMWAKIGFAYTRQDYEAARDARERIREFEALELKDLEESA